jgi:hemolysin-activating ACP:hemolysin acyltransferase
MTQLLAMLRSVSLRNAPFGGHAAMAKDLKEKVFPEQELKYLGLDDGKVVVKVV